MSHLEPNLSADKTMSVLAELIKAGRYSNPNTSITKLLKEAAEIKAKIEAFYSDRS